jgi:aryl-alcohol dehydrogenase-like predicted oxidoreductase
MIDTAEMSHYGRSEKIVGQVIKKVGGDSVFVTTKLLSE